jgi:hypothetical protein
VLIEGFELLSHIGCCYSIRATEKAFLQEDNQENSKERGDIIQNSVGEVIALLATNILN